MAVFPQKPRTGQKVLQGLYNSVCQIIDYLPSLEVKGDNSSTSVSKTSNGTIIHTTNNYSTLSQNRKLFGWHGILVKNDQYIACTLTGGNYITVNYYEQGHYDDPDYTLEFPTINCNLSGGRYIQITSAGVINYTGPSGGGGGGQEYYDGRFIKISSDFSINCTLSALTELYNDPLVEHSRVTFPTTSHVITSDVGYYSTHFVQSQDIFHDGVGTTVNYHWHRSPFGDEPTAMVGLIDGFQVDLTLSGGRFTDVYLYQNKGGYGPTSQDPEPPTEYKVNCLLSGDNQHIFISQQTPNENGSWGGIISTNIHGDETTIHMAADGTLSAIGGGGGGGTGDLSTVYRKTQGYLTAVPGTRYVVIQGSSMSSNIVDYPDDDPSSMSSYLDGHRIYQYFFQDTPWKFFTTTLSTVEGDQKWGAIYHGTYSDEWHDYDSGNGFGTIFVFEQKAQDCYLEIDASYWGNGMAIAPSGTMIWSTNDSSKASGTPESWWQSYRAGTLPSLVTTWGIPIYQGSKYIFTYDSSSNLWYATTIS